MTLSVGTSQKNNAYEKTHENKGVVAAVLAAGACGAVGTIPAKLILKEMGKMNDKMSSSQINDVRNALQRGLKESELLKKGVNFLEVVVQKPQNWLQKNSSNLVLQTMFGKNACFVPKGWCRLADGTTYNLKNTIFVPQNKMMYSWFHEMGHALNYNNGGYAKVLQVMRGPAQIISMALPIVALFAKKRDENGEKPLSTYGKTMNFIRNNAGKLTFLCFIPSLIEEGMATAKGQKWAEKLLPSEVTGKMLKNNKLGFLTYAITALVTSFCAYAGVKVKDMYIENKKKQQQNKLAA